MLSTRFAQLILCKFVQISSGRQIRIGQHEGHEPKVQPIDKQSSKKIHLPHMTNLFARLAEGLAPLSLAGRTIHRAVPGIMAAGRYR